MSKGKDYTIKCDTCKRESKMNLYCIAQLASGNDMIFTCRCNEEIHIDADEFNNR